jgi:hypothetical protein
MNQATRASASSVRSPSRPSTWRLGSATKMAQVDSVAAAEDMAGVYQVVLVQDAALDGRTPSMLIADEALVDVGHAHRLPVLERVCLDPGRGVQPER